MLAAVAAQHRRFLGLQDESRSKKATAAGLSGGRGMERGPTKRARLTGPGRGTRTEVGWEALVLSRRHISFSATSPPLDASCQVGGAGGRVGWESMVLSRRQTANATVIYEGEAARAALSSASIGGALAAAYSAGYVESWARASLNWRAACRLLDTSPFPVTVGPLLLVLTDRVTRLGLEPDGLGTWISALRSAVDQGRLGWNLDPLDERMVRILRRGLVKSFKGQNARGKKTGLGLALLGRMMDHSRETHTRAQQALLQMRVAHAGFLRTGEHAGSHKPNSRIPLRCGDVEFLVAEAALGQPGRVRFATTLEEVVGVRLSLHMAKTGHLDTPPQTVLIGRRADRWDVVEALWHHVQDKGGFSDASLPLFTLSGAEYRKELAAWLVRIGEDPAPFGGHSTRRGACNDALDDGVPLETVMKAGRWKSLAWAEYRELTPSAMRRLASVLPAAGVRPVSQTMVCLWELKAALKAGAE